MYTTTTICQITQNSKTILIAEFSVFALIPQQRKNQTNSLNQLLIITEGNIVIMHRVPLVRQAARYASRNDYFNSIFNILFEARVNNLEWDSVSFNKTIKYASASNSKGFVFKLFFFWGLFFQIKNSTKVATW